MSKFNFINYDYLINLLSENNIKFKIVPIERTKKYKIYILKKSDDKKIFPIANPYENKQEQIPEKYITHIFSKLRKVKDYENINFSEIKRQIEWMPPDEK